MCTLLLAYRAHPHYRLIVAANRDEYYQRPTAPASFWDDAPAIFAGRDLVHGGTWFGVTREGRLAALTNYRDPADLVRHGPSRGILVSGFLQAQGSAEEFVARLRREGARYGGYNLLMGEGGRLHCYSSRTDRLEPVAPGLHGLSNHLLDTPWPKVARGKEELARLLEQGDVVAPEHLFALLADRTHPADDRLPDTGVGLELERLLSPIFIESERYGTRCSTVLLVENDGRVNMVERSFTEGGVSESSVRLKWS